MKKLTIAIVGAGLGGLAVAQALKHHDVDVDIFESDAAFDSRPQGYRIRIDASGQQALAQVLSPELYRLFCATASTTATSGGFLTPQLTPSLNRVPESWHQDSLDIAQDMSINRRTLREILICGLESHVHFGRKFEGYTLTDDGRVIVSSAHHADKIYDLLIGADGVNSRVRSQLAAMAEPERNGTLCIYGKTDIARFNQDAARLSGTNIIFADGLSVILDQMQFDPQAFQPRHDNQQTCTLSVVSDYLYWCFIGPEERFDLQIDSSINSTQLRDRLALLTADWHPSLRQILSNSEAKEIAMLPIRCGRPEILWPAGVVTLLGDAIHAMTPAGGLGANTALVDAAELAQAILQVKAEQCGSVEAIMQYESAMRPRAVNAIAVSNSGAAKLFTGIVSAQH